MGCKHALDTHPRHLRQAWHILDFRCAPTFGKRVWRIGKAMDPAYYIASVHFDRTNRTLHYFCHFVVIQSLNDHIQHTGFCFSEFFAIVDLIMVFILKNAFDLFKKTVMIKWFFDT
jgi:hypothetical protein